MNTWNARLIHNMTFPKTLQSLISKIFLINGESFKSHAHILSLTLTVIFLFVTKFQEPIRLRPFIFLRGRCQRHRITYLIIPGIHLNSIQIHNDWKECFMFCLKIKYIVTLCCWNPKYVDSEWSYYVLPKQISPLMRLAAENILCDSVNNYISISCKYFYEIFPM